MRSSKTLQRTARWERMAATGQTFWSRGYDESSVAVDKSTVCDPKKKPRYCVVKISR